jgi:flagellar biosynthetic protein FliP
MRRFAAAITLVIAAAGGAAAQVPGGLGGDTASSLIQTFGVLTVLAIAPGLLVMMTSFTRIVIVLSILRSGLGLQSTPANLVLISLALFMTFHIMAPTLDKAWTDGLQPLSRKEITEAEAFDRIADPFRGFMMAQVRDRDLDLFVDLARERGQTVGTPEKVELRVLIPAFMISELRRGFEIGFLVVLPFLVIDLIVATVTMAMGMMMLPPTVLSLPFKILFFVLIDGWSLLTGSLVRSFS